MNPSLFFFAFSFEGLKLVETCFLLSLELLRGSKLEANDACKDEGQA
jgi:hypothetical protein